MMIKKKRIAYIDKAKGLAIFLVVYGHITLRTFPEGNDWYYISRKVVSLFHMPFFMVISGYVMLYTYQSLETFHDYTQYISGKFKRLMPAFIFFGVVIFIGKILLSTIFYVDNLSKGIFKDTINLFFFPQKSVASSLWYIYVLFIMYFIISPLLQVLNRYFSTKKSTTILMIIGIFLYYFPWGTFFLAQSAVFHFFFFFAFGMHLASCGEKIKEVFDKFFWPFIVCFIFTIALFLTDIVYGKTTNFLIALASIPALFSLVRFKPFCPSFLLFIGRLSFPIYLMNTISIGLTKGVLLKLTSWDGTNFSYMVPILIINGLFIPIVIKKYIFPHIPILDRITN